MAKFADMLADFDSLLGAAGDAQAKQKEQKKKDKAQSGTHKQQKGGSQLKSSSKQKKQKTEEKAHPGRQLQQRRASQIEATPDMQKKRKQLGSERHPVQQDTGNKQSPAKKQRLQQKPWSNVGTKGTMGATPPAGQPGCVVVDSPGQEASRAYKGYQAGQGKSIKHQAPKGYKEQAVQRSAGKQVEAPGGQKVWSQHTGHTTQHQRLKLKTVPPPVNALKSSDTNQLAWPFPVDYNDHFETCQEALQHADVLLSWLAKKLGKSKAQLVLYDPYYCAGGVVGLWQQLGYTNVINKKRDFYADMDSGTIPEYDVLVTNPPYSADHKERILEFCMSSHKPWLLLMPNYVANKAYYSHALQAQYTQTGTVSVDPGGGLKLPVLDYKQRHTQRSSVQQRQPAPSNEKAGKLPPPLYLVPHVKYEFHHPQGTGHASSPFFSIWYCHLGPLQHTNDLRDTLQRAADSHSAGGGVRMVDSVDALRSVGAAPAWKRPNPRQRKKMKQNKA